MLKLDKILSRCFSFLNNFSEIDFLYIGALPTPTHLHQLKPFLLNMGISEDTAINCIAHACSLDTINENVFFETTLLTNTLAILDGPANTILYSTNPLSTSLLDKKLLSKYGIDCVAAITTQDIRSMPEFYGHEMHYQDVIFRKILQDLIIDSFENNFTSVVIFLNNGDVITSVSSDLFSRKIDNLFFNESIFIDFILFLDTFRDKGAYSFEIYNNTINTFIEADLKEKIVTLSFKYSPSTENFTFNSEILPNPEKINGLTLFSYNNTITKDFIVNDLSEITKRRNILFISAPRDRSDLFKVNLSTDKKWEKSPQIAHADILICCLNDYSDIDKLLNICSSGKPTILLSSASSAIDMLHRITSQPSVNSSQIRSVSHATILPLTCRFCASEVRSYSPIKLSSYVELEQYIAAGEMVVKRNHDGCNKCSFGIYSMVGVIDKIDITKSFLREFSISENDSELMRKIEDDIYHSSTDFKISKVRSLAIDPNDIHT